MVGDIQKRIRFFGLNKEFSEERLKGALFVWKRISGCGGDVQSLRDCGNDTLFYPGVLPWAIHIQALPVRSGVPAGLIIILDSGANNLFTHIQICRIGEK